MLTLSESVSEMSYLFMSYWTVELVNIIIQSRSADLNRIAFELVKIDEQKVWNGKQILLQTFFSDHSL